MKEITPLIVANWFLTKESMTLKKVQKLVYYAYSWYLILMNEKVDDLKNKLFDEKIKAWVHGPSIPMLYNEFKEHKYNSIPKINDFNEQEYFNLDTIDILNQVWDEYGHYSANQLESITHQEDPWIKARKGFGPLDSCNETISDKEIFSYYIKQMKID